MTVRWMVCTIALLLSCSSEDGGMTDDGGTGGAAGSSGASGTAGTGAGGMGGSGGTAGRGATGGTGGVNGQGGTVGTAGTSGGAILAEDFESGIGEWFADNGVWEVGQVSVGPSSCFDDSMECAGTVLDGNYPGGGGGVGTKSHTSRLISGIIALPVVSAKEELHLRFQNWFEYRASAFHADSGQVQVAVRDGDGEFGEWVSEGSRVTTMSAGWSLKDVELTSYAGETIRVAFLLQAPIGGNPGWYLDDVGIIAKTPEFTGEFESGWSDWSAGNGVWQVGEAVDLEDGCFTGSQCAGTVLDGPYPGGGGGVGTRTFSSRLTSATFTLPNVSPGGELRLRFWNWFEYNASAFHSDSGQVQISVRDESGAFQDWANEGTRVISQSGGWTQKNVDLTTYAGETVRLGFLHRAPIGGRRGWFVDDIEFVTF